MGLATARAFADVVVVFVRQPIVALMQPIAFAAAQLNLALHDGSLSPIPVLSSFDLDASAARSVTRSAQRAEWAVGAAVDDGDDMVGGEIAA